MSNQCDCNCSCDTPVIFIYSCSGAADTGEISDLAARQLSKEKVGQMKCLAGIGGKIDDILTEIDSADVIIVIDGCQLDCAKHTFENAGITDFIHLRVTDLGLEKSKSPATKENVNIVVDKVKKILS